MQRPCLTASPVRTAAFDSPIASGKRSQWPPKPSESLPAEFVQDRILELIRNPGAATPVALPSNLVPLVERSLRYSYMIATKIRGEMIAEGREEELDTLIKEARTLQDTLQSEGTD